MIKGVLASDVGGACRYFFKTNFATLLNINFTIPGLWKLYNTSGMDESSSEEYVSADEGLNGSSDVR